jgi:nitroreductase
MTEQKPTQEQIECILEAGTHAPNHHKVEPWRFYVLAGKARNEMGSIMEASLRERMPDSSTSVSQAQLKKEREKPLRAPVVLVVAARHAEEPGVVEIENVEAVAAAVENMLLTAEDMGLAAMWRTGDSAYDPKLKKWLNLATEDHIIAFVYLGYAAITSTERRPTPVASKTAWLGWD